MVRAEDEAELAVEAMLNGWMGKLRDVTGKWLGSCVSFSGYSGSFFQKEEVYGSHWDSTSWLAENGNDKVKKIIIIIIKQKSP